MKHWVVYSTCSIFALCSPAEIASGPPAEDGAMPPAALEPGPLGGAAEPAPLPTGA
jgi:hypothetical protein